MIKYLCSPLLILAFPANLHAQVPTWSNDVASIIYNHCSVCHHSGAIAPFSLMSYYDAVAYGFSIQAAINASTMPPWPPDPGYNHLNNEKVLSAQEINIINEWVNNYMPSGDLAVAPAPPVFYGNSVMVQPDDTVILPLFTIPSNGEEYMTFTIHSDYTETKYINQLEFIPGDPSLVHHSIYYQDTSEVSWQKDLEYPGPGFPTYSVDMSPYLASFGGFVPGQGLLKFPSYMGIEILPGTDFVIDIHYSPGNAGKTDSSKLLLKFSDDPNVRPIFEERYLFAAPPCLVNGPLFIPANTVATFNEQTTLPYKKSLLGLVPHSHLICTSWKVYAVKPSGDTIKMINIPKWDFGWQYTYLFTKVISVFPGTTFYGEAVFDNTPNNANNPSNPPQDVDAGQSTFDEMMACRFWVMDYQEGDEDIILDSAFYGYTESAAIVKPEHKLNLFPNPSDKWVRFTLHVPGNKLSWSLTNALLQEVASGTENKAAGIFEKTIDVSALPRSIYFLSVKVNEKTYNSKVMVAH
jgi:hypothetical protein